MFKKRYDNVFTYYLPTNFRSSDKIINLSNNLITQNNRRLEKSMKSSGKKAENGDIYKLSFITKNEEIKFIVNRIRNLVGIEWIDKNGRTRGLEYSDIAMFFRSVKYDSQLYLEALDKAGIPFAVSGVGGLFESPEVDVIFCIFSYLGNFKKIWDRENKTGYIPTEEEIFDEANQLFPLPDQKKFIQILQEFKDNIQK